jgi:hypothetical protein
LIVTFGAVKKLAIQLPLKDRISLANTLRKTLPARQQAMLAKRHFWRLGKVARA